MSRTIVTLLCKVNFIIIIIQTALVCGQDYGHTPVLGARGPSASCYNDLGLPQRCLPEFENAAYGVQMEATNTCGENGEIRYCIQTGTSTRKSCDICGREQFQSYYLTDLHHEQDNQTWWQSETMNEGIQYPNQVNLTLHLGKAYDITYVRVVFYSPRPESFSIYKRTKEDGEWVPYQYYSASCRETYGLLDSLSVPRGAETMALCTSEYSDISPLRGGNVAFSTLEGRPSAFSFEFSPELQEWVTATDLRITLDRLNTFGDELFGDQQVMQSYWYAVADVAVGARCKCNGHASRWEGVEGARRCICEHRTAGRDCEKCEDFYNDAPWGRASQSDVHECKACNCNGFSDRCYFDKDLYEKTGHGGHCLDCMENRDGPNCEHCKENFYQREDNVCIFCNCNATGSRSLQCNSEGRCQCKPGVIGEKCDQCAPNHYEFTNQGCSPCGCSEEGSYDNTPQCDPYSGVCYCKENVEGKRCRECKPGFFNLDLNNEYGCTPCFCYGHSSECSPAGDYSQVTLESMFVRGPEKWIGQDSQHNTIPLKYNAMTQNVALAAQANEQLYFIAPERFLGDQRASYNRDIKFTLRIGEDNPYASSSDLILEGAGNYVAINIFGQGNPEPAIQSTEYTFRLNEHPDYGWSPKLSTFGFLSILSNLTAIRIRGTYTPGGKGFFDNFKMETARRGTAGVPALWVEMCSCPVGYVGQFCESCDPGFRHSPASKGPFMPCIPCECNGHAKICDAETGLCICEHNTGGDNCELCARGYYGNALGGNENDCTKCPCPLQGACIQMSDQTIVCTECPTGYAGIRCDLCADGYFVAGQDVLGGVICMPCDCNLNVDLNAVGNCNRTSGACLKCIYNTAGEHCDRCLNGFYGNALAPTKGDCRPCECYSVGTLESEAGPPLCDPLSGQCACRPHVTGRNCDKCQEGYYKIMSGEGCQACDCNLEGSYNYTCQLVTGQCHCKPGITGLHCDQCKPFHYGFSSEGCTACDCDQHGSTSEQCDRNGQCPCQENVEGRRCDRCKENKHNREGQNGCEDCPACYNLVQDSVNQHRRGLNELQGVLLKISKDPTVVQNSDFDVELASAKSLLNGLAEKATDASGIGDGEKTLVQKVDELNDRLDHVRDLLDNVEKSTEEANISGKDGAQNAKSADAIIEEARKEWNLAWDNLQNDGAAALAKAQNRSDQFGQQSTQMSVIAQEARMIAEKLETEVLNIRQVADNAYNTSLEAYKLAKDGIGQQTNISNELLILTNDMAVAGHTFKTVQNLTAQALARAMAAYNDALDIYAEVNSTNIANFDAAEIQKHAAVMIKEANNVQNKANNLNEQHKGMLADLNNQIGKGRDLLLLGMDRQEDLQDIFTRLDEIRAKAERAVKQTNSTLQDALTIHDTLKQFRNEVQESRQKAESEIKQIPKIKENVERAKEMTLLVINDLEEAGKNAKSARDIAQEAQNEYAQKASQEAHEIRKKAAATRVDAGKLHDEANQLSGRVAETARQMEMLEERVDDDTNLTTDAENKVGQAKTDAEEAQKLVKKAMQDVLVITEELKNLPLLNDNALDQLEQHLEEAERELKKLDLVEKILTLQAAKNTHQRWVKDRQDEAEKLEAEVDNVKDILDALPVGCFKRLNLEP